MKYIIFLISYYLFCYGQQIELREKCQCSDIFTQYDCLQLGSCEWDSVNMRCSQTTKQYSTRYILENTRLSSGLQSYSFYCEMFDELSCPSQKSCAWFKNSCTFFTGCSAYLRPTHEECQALSIECISDGYQCVQKSNCETYKNPYSCTKNEFGQFCYWNTNTNQCEFPNSCSKLPLTFTTHDECNSQLDFCTVDEVGGCIMMGSKCSDQNTQASCVTNLKKTKQCFWAVNSCKEVICENALQSLKTDQECKQFLQQCTTKSQGGCVQRMECSDAQVEEACVTNQWNEKCIWNGKSCSESFCQNAPQTYTTNQQCKQIHAICISNGKGCVSNYACGLANQEQYCESDGYGKECYWNSVRCVLKTCDLADETYFGDACSKFMYTCTGKFDGTRGCIEKNCQNAPITIQTNEDCETYFPKNNCVIKKGGGCRIGTNCGQIDFEEGCTKDIYNNLCQWSNSESKCYRISSCGSIKIQKYCIIDQFGEDCEWMQQDNQNGKCIYKSCQTAPLNLQNEQQCQDYFTKNICTVKQGGGCRIKTYCQDADFKEACTTDLDGKECFWNDIQMLCRLKQCSDINQNTFLACQKINNQCTLGFDGKCDIMRNCNEFTNKYQCIQGIDGPCLWINDNNQGSCYQYESCNTMKWQTDQQCKMISQYCTTDGNQCVSITRCNQTNTNGGCVTGIEGSCVQSVPELGSQRSKQCQVFFNCNDAFYLTHDECQLASKYCTTNSITGCRDLVACDYYDQNNCYLNNIGVVYDDGLILSTGKCKWDNLQCRDENCQDFEYQTSSDCNQILSKCTSDGKKCIVKQMCSIYDENLCEIANGIEGPCRWSEGICKPLICEEIKNPTNQNTCQLVENCIFDGIKCITQLNCSKYITKTACNQDGLDGICVWQEQLKQCNLMINCQSANFDQIACAKANDRCNWQSNDQCKDYTCETLFKQGGECKYFPNWNYKKLNICKMKFGKCQFFDINQTNEIECLNFSLQIYRWNPLSNKCSECSTAINASENVIADPSQLPPTLFSQIQINLIFCLFFFII